MASRQKQIRIAYIELSWVFAPFAYFAFPVQFALLLASLQVKLDYLIIRIAVDVAHVSARNSHARHTTHLHQNLRRCEQL
jgi:hypothetical protein